MSTQYGTKSITIVIVVAKEGERGEEKPVETLCMLWYIALCQLTMIQLIAQHFGIDVFFNAHFFATFSRITSHIYMV